MCGISGWFTQSPNPPEAKTRLQAMNVALAHRGPDASGSRLFTHAALGHTRLAIIDPSHGQQPMQNGPLHLSFNGEIYNYPTLRSQLSAQGIRIESDSDSAVLLALLRQHGPEGLKQVRGMYALALWNEDTQSGYLARDPHGIKPLFYAQHGERLLFGSEAKAILAAQAQRPKLDPQALHLLLNYRYLPGRYSMFQGIEQLAPGEILHWQTDGTQQRQQIDWRVPQTNTPTVIDALKDSVKAHCIADVPLGIYLSGGLDSAAIAQFALESGQPPQTSFTLEVGDDPQEARYAAETAQYLGLDNQQQPLHIQPEDDLKTLIHHLEVPKINALQGLVLARHASSQVKVALSGLGGDELFLGYNAHRILARLGALQQHSPASLRRAIATLGQPIARLFGHHNEIQRGLRMIQQLGDWPAVYGQMRNLWDSPTMRQKIYGERMLDTPLPNAWDDLRSRWPSDTNDPLEAMRQFEWHNKMVNDLLWNDDRVSMACGLEVRVPFVDRQLAAALSHYTREQLMPDKRPKQQMRNWLKPHLTAAIFRRPKSGFQVHAGAFFQQQLTALANDYLNPSTTRAHGLFNPDYITQLRRLPPSKAHRWHYFMLYLMLLTHLWLDHFE